MSKICIGCWKRNYGPDWIHIDRIPYDHVDIITDKLDDLPFDDNTL